MLVKQNFLRISIVLMIYPRLILFSETINNELLQKLRYFYFIHHIAISFP